MIALGSNVGDRVAWLSGARKSVGAIPGVEVTAASALYATEPVGGPAQAEFLNACLAVRTSLAPADLLARLHDIEHAAGRQRLVENGPRTLDLDLLLVGDVEVASPTLTLPHPRLNQRAFVLVPAAEVAAAWIVPGTGGRTIGYFHDCLARGRGLENGVRMFAGASTW